MTDLFGEFQEFRKILCICPICGELVRVSDLKLKVKGPAVKTWLDNYQKQAQDMEVKEEKFEEIEKKLREVAVIKGRKAAEVAVNKIILPSFRALKLDPLDIKPILNPVDFVAFRGMNKKEDIDEILFLSKNYPSPVLELARKQIQKVILEKKYEWQVARIDDMGKIEFE